MPSSRANIAWQNAARARGRLSAFVVPTEDTFNIFRSPSKNVCTDPTQMPAIEAFPSEDVFYTCSVILQNNLIYGKFVEISRCMHFCLACKRDTQRTIDVSFACGTEELMMITARESTLAPRSENAVRNIRCSQTAYSRSLQSLITYFHIGLGLVKQLVKALDFGEAFQEIRVMFPKLSGAKIKYKVNTAVLEITCTVETSDNPSVQWTFRWMLDSQAIRLGRSGRVYVNAVGCCTEVLHVETLYGYEHGMYTCEAAATGMKLTRSFLVEPGQSRVVIEPAGLVVRQVRIWNMGGSAGLRCVGVSLPGLWKRNFKVEWTPTEVGQQMTKPRWDEYLGPLYLQGEIPQALQWAESVLILDNITDTMTLNCSIVSQPEVKADIRFPSCHVSFAHESYSTTLLRPTEAHSTVVVGLLGPLEPACEAHLLRGVLWPLTREGKFSVQGCPRGFVGQAKRVCTLESVPLSPSFTISPISTAATQINGSSSSAPTPSVNFPSSGSLSEKSTSAGEASFVWANLPSPAPSASPTDVAQARAKPVWQAPDYTQCLHQSFEESRRAIKRAEKIFHGFDSCDAKSSTQQRLLGQLSSYLTSGFALPGSCDLIWTLLFTAHRIPVTIGASKTQARVRRKPKTSDHLINETPVRCEHEDQEILLAADILAQFQGAAVIQNWPGFLEAFHHLVKDKLRRSTTSFKSSNSVANFTTYNWVTIGDMGTPVVTSGRLLASGYEDVTVEVTVQWSDLSASEAPSLRSAGLLLFKSTAMLPPFSQDSWALKINHIFGAAATAAGVVVVGGHVFQTNAPKSKVTLQLILRTALQPLHNLTRGHPEALQCGQLGKASSWTACSGPARDEVVTENAKVTCSCPTEGSFTVFVRHLAVLGENELPLQPPRPATAHNLVVVCGCVTAASVVAVVLCVTRCWQRMEDVVVTVGATAFVLLMVAAACCAAVPSLLVSCTPVVPSLLSNGTFEYLRPSNMTICTILKKEEIKKLDVAKGVTVTSKYRPKLLEDVEKLLLVRINEKQLKDNSVSETIYGLRTD
ncbi:Immunoglobulin-like domain [Trinorchestia longiramus]|nr:Immunoglobulin-like domain [Trinorchestia longiramus]